MLLYACDLEVLGVDNALPKLTSMERHLRVELLCFPNITITCYFYHTGCLFYVDLKLFLIHVFVAFICMHVYVCAHMQATVFMWSSEDNLLRVGFHFP